MYKVKKENKNRRNIHNLILSRNNSNIAIYEHPNSNFEYRLLKNYNPPVLIRVNESGKTNTKVYKQRVKQHGKYLIINNTVNRQRNVNIPKTITWTRMSNTPRYEATNKNTHYTYFPKTSKIVIKKLNEPTIVVYKKLSLNNTR